MPPIRLRALTLLPEFFQAALVDGVFARASKQGIIDFSAHQLRDFSDRADRRIDDKPYGGGHGMVIRADVTTQALRHLKNPETKVIFTTPSGQLFNSSIARRLANEKDLLFVCGRYEGFDQRVIDSFADFQLSVGDFVLSGGELAALAMMDAIARFVPGVLGNAESADHDSFEDGLLEGPLFTRPEVFEELRVPAVLLSGDHAKVAEYQRHEKIKRTAKVRPDLIKSLWQSMTKPEQDLARSAMEMGTK
jgi:tRNA (guanine37-N1)-methyltransferase